MVVASLDGTDRDLDVRGRLIAWLNRELREWSFVVREPRYERTAAQGGYAVVIGELQVARGPHGVAGTRSAVGSAEVGVGGWGEAVERAETSALRRAALMFLGEPTPLGSARPDTGPFPVPDDGRQVLGGVPVGGRPASGDDRLITTRQLAFVQKLCREAHVDPATVASEEGVGNLAGLPFDRVNEVIEKLKARAAFNGGLTSTMRPKENH